MCLCLQSWAFRRNTSWKIQLNRKVLQCILYHGPRGRWIFCLHANRSWSNNNYQSMNVLDRIQLKTYRGFCSNNLRNVSNPKVLLTTCRLIATPLGEIQILEVVLHKYLPLFLQSHKPNQHHIKNFIMLMSSKCWKCTNWWQFSYGSGRFQLVTFENLIKTFDNVANFLLDKFTVLIPLQCEGPTPT